MGCHALLQGIFPTQESNTHLICLPHWQAGSLPQHLVGSPNLTTHALYLIQIAWFPFPHTARTAWSWPSAFTDGHSGFFHRCDSKPCSSLRRSLNAPPPLHPDCSSRGHLLCQRRPWVVPPTECQVVKTELPHPYVSHRKSELPHPYVSHRKTELRYPYVSHRKTELPYPYVSHSIARVAHGHELLIECIC